MIIGEFIVKSGLEPQKKRESVKTTKITCTKCSKDLGEMIETNPKLANDTEIKHTFVCPCGGESFVVKVKYLAFFLAAEGLITSTISEVSTNRFKSVLEYHDGEEITNAT